MPTFYCISEKLEDPHFHLKIIPILVVFVYGQQLASLGGFLSSHVSRNDNIGHMYIQSFVESEESLRTSCPNAHNNTHILLSQFFQIF